MKFRYAPALGALLVGVSCGGHRDSVNVDVTGDQPFSNVTLQIQIDDAPPKAFGPVTFGPGIAFKASVYVASGVTGAVQITGRADNGQCVVGRGGPVTGTVNAGSAAALTIVQIAPCEPFPTDGGADAADVAGTGGRGTGGADVGTGGAGAGTGGSGTGGVVGTGGAGTGGVSTGGAGGRGSGGAGTGGRGTGGAGGTGNVGSGGRGTGGIGTGGRAGGGGGAGGRGTGGAGTGGAGTGGAGTGGAGTGGVPVNPCMNKVKDGNETDVDCGGNASGSGPACPRCAEGKACAAAADCAAGSQCAFGACRGKYPPIDSALVAFWPLDTDTKDVSGNHNDTIGFRAVTAVAGKVGGAYQLPGDGCLIAPDSASLDMVGTTAMTMMAWVNTTAGATAAVAACISGQDEAVILNKESSYEMAISCTDGSYQHAIAPAGSGWGWVGTRVVGTGAWHHVVTAWDGAVVRLYVDGVMYDGFSLTGMLGDQSSGLGIGCRYVRPDATTSDIAAFFTGIVDEVAVYKRALSATEISDYYNRTK